VEAHHAGRQRRPQAGAGASPSVLNRLSWGLLALPMRGRWMGGCLAHPPQVTLQSLLAWLFSSALVWMDRGCPFNDALQALELLAPGRLVANGGAGRL